MTIESTIHSIYFHEDTSIYSIEISEEHLFTSGGDAKIRAWHVGTEKLKESTFTYSTAINSSVKINYCSTFESLHKAAVNSLRFNSTKKLLASCGDDGTVFIWQIDGCEAKGTEIYRGEKVTEICWANNRLIIGTAKGTLILVKIEEIYKDDVINIKSSILHKIRPHTLAIEGICFNHKHCLISTLSKDRTCKIFKITEKFAVVEKIENYGGEKLFCDENCLIMFRRHTFSACGNFLYLCCTMSDSIFYVYVMHYPFHSKDFYGRIGPFKSPVLKIIEIDGELIFFTKSAVYKMNEEIYVENATMLSVFDACLHNNIIYIGSADGFVSSIRIEK